MKRRVLEENILDKPAIDAGVDLVARVKNVTQSGPVSDNDQRTRPGLAHFPAGRRQFFQLPRRHAGLLRLTEQFFEYALLCRSGAGTDALQETADFRLEDHQQGHHAHAQHLSQDERKQLHSHSPRSDPYHIQQQDTQEDIDRRRAADHPDQPVDEQADHQHVDERNIYEVEHILTNITLFLLRHARPDQASLLHSSFLPKPRRLSVYFIRSREISHTSPPLNTA